jgi:hypothetical protein
MQGAKDLDLVQLILVTIFIQCNRSCLIKIKQLKFKIKILYALKIKAAFKFELSNFNQTIMINCILTTAKVTASNSFS